MNVESKNLGLVLGSRYGGDRALPDVLSSDQVMVFKDAVAWSPRIWRQGVPRAFPGVAR
jgi:hypothetical protein